MASSHGPSSMVVVAVALLPRGAFASLPLLPRTSRSLSLIDHVNHRASVALSVSSASPPTSLVLVSSIGYCRGDCRPSLESPIFRAAFVVQESTSHLSALDYSPSDRLIYLSIHLSF